MTASPRRSSGSIRLGIRAAGYALAGKARELTDWGRLHADAPGELVASLQRAGHHFYHRGDAQQQAELCIAATTDGLRRADLKGSDIDVVVLAQTVKDRTSAVSHELLEAVCRAHAVRPTLRFVLTDLACASLMGAIWTLQALMDRQPSLRRALIFTVDRIADESRRNIGSVGLQSDGASCLVLERGHSRGIVEAIVIRNFATFSAGYGATEKEAARLDQTFHLAAIQTLAKAFRAAEFDASSVDLILPHNANAPAWSYIARGLKVDPTRVYLDNIASKGHMFCSDFPINWLTSGAADGPARRRVAAFSMGITGAFAAVTLTT